MTELAYGSPDFDPSAEPAMDPVESTALAEQTDLNSEDYPQWVKDASTDRGGLEEVIRNVDAMNAALANSGIDPRTGEKLDKGQEYKPLTVYDVLTQDGVDDESEPGSQSNFGTSGQTSGRGPGAKPTPAAVFGSPQTSGRGPGAKPTPAAAGPGEEFTDDDELDTGEQLDLIEGLSRVRDKKFGRYVVAATLLAQGLAVPGGMVERPDIPGHEITLVAPDSGITTTFETTSTESRLASGVGDASVDQAALQGVIDQVNEAQANGKEVRVKVKGSASDDGNLDKADQYNIDLANERGRSVAGAITEGTGLGVTILDGEEVDRPVGTPEDQLQGDRGVDVSVTGTKQIVNFYEHDPSTAYTPDQEQSPVQDPAEKLNGEKGVLFYADVPTEREQPTDQPLPPNNDGENLPSGPEGGVSGLQTSGRDDERATMMSGGGQKSGRPRNAKPTPAAAGPGNLQTSGRTRIVGRFRGPTKGSLTTSSKRSFF